MRVSEVALILCFLFACCQEDLKYVEKEYPNRIVCVYGVKYWLSSGYNILTLLVDMEGKPLACE